MVKISLTQGRAALVDDDDAEWLSRFTWRPSKSRKLVYACAEINGRTVGMHRLLLSPPDGLVVDHINHDGLDNRRANLRVVTQQQNLQRKRPHGRGSKFKGVSRYPSKTSPWQVKITVGGKLKHVGVFATEELAAQAYDAAARVAFGQFAYLNFPDVVAEYFAHHPLAKRGR